MSDNGHDINGLQDRIQHLRQLLAELTAEKDFEELLRIIHFPGYTTLAEFQLVSGIVDAMNGHAQVLVAQKQLLIEGSRTIIG